MMARSQRSQSHRGEEGLSIYIEKEKLAPAFLTDVVDPCSLTKSHWFVHTIHKVSVTIVI